MSSRASVCSGTRAMSSKKPDAAPPGGNPTDNGRLPGAFRPPLHLSFVYALRGIGGAVLRERNLRIHLAAGAAALWTARYFALTSAEWALLVLTIGIVITCELFNTAVERLTDLAARRHEHPLAAAAKDIAAGAVLVSAFASVAVALLLMNDPAAWRALLAEALAAPVPYLLAGAAAVIWVWGPEAGGGGK